MIIGLISDTHGHFDERIPELFREVEHIVHAGDIGSAEILRRLESIAPVTAVLGNNDFDPRLREFETVELASRRLLVHHIVDPRHPSEALRERLLRSNPDVVIGGHTHKACSVTVGQRLFLNPGYAGRPRFGMPRSLALLHCGPRALRPEFISLEPHPDAGERLTPPVP